MYSSIRSFKIGFDILDRKWRLICSVLPMIVEKRQLPDNESVSGDKWTSLECPLSEIKSRDYKDCLKLYISMTFSIAHVFMLSFVWNYILHSLCLFYKNTLICAMDLYGLEYNKKNTDSAYLSFSMPRMYILSQGSNCEKWTGRVRNTAGTKGLGGHNGMNRGPPPPVNSNPVLSLYFSAGDQRLVSTNLPYRVNFVFHENVPQIKNEYEYNPGQHSSGSSVR